MVNYFNDIKLNNEYDTPIGKAIIDKITPTYIYVYWVDLEYHMRFKDAGGIHRFIKSKRNYDKSQICMNHREVKCCKECCQYYTCINKSELDSTPIIKPKKKVRTLGESDVEFILKHYNPKSKNYNVIELAKHFNTYVSHIKRIVKGKKK